MSEKPKAYTAWLIARIGLGHPCWFAGNSWTTNPNEAIKFRFKEDAIRMIHDLPKMIGRFWFEVRAEDHQWGFTDELEDGA